MTLHPSHPKWYVTLFKWLVIFYCVLALISWCLPVFFSSAKMDLTALVVIVLVPGTLGALIVAHREHRRNVAKHIAQHGHQHAG